MVLCLASAWAFLGWTLARARLVINVCRNAWKSAMRPDESRYARNPDRWRCAFSWSVRASSIHAFLAVAKSKRTISAAARLLAHDPGHRGASAGLPSSHCLSMATRSALSGRVASWPFFVYPP
jgi:hypothetical protein